MLATHPLASRKNLDLLVNLVGGGQPKLVHPKFNPAPRNERMEVSSRVILRRARLAQPTLNGDALVGDTDWYVLFAGVVLHVGK